MHSNAENQTELGTGMYPTFSTDGSKILYSKADFLISIENNDETNQTVVGKGVRGMYPCFSPDGARIVFIPGREGEGQYLA